MFKNILLIALIGLFFGGVYIYHHHKGRFEMQKTLISANEMQYAHSYDCTDWIEMKGDFLPYALKNINIGLTRVLGRDLSPLTYLKNTADDAETIMIADESPDNLLVMTEVKNPQNAMETAQGVTWLKGYDGAILKLSSAGIESVPLVNYPEKVIEGAGAVELYMLAGMNTDTGLTIYEREGVIGIYAVNKQLTPSAFSCQLNEGCEVSGYDETPSQMEQTRQWAKEFVLPELRRACEQIRTQSARNIQLLNRYQHIEGTCAKRVNAQELSKSYQRKVLECGRLLEKLPQEVERYFKMMSEINPEIQGGDFTPFPTDGGRGGAP